MQIPVFLINLDRSPDRLQRSAAELAKLGLAFVRIPAIDGKTLDLQTLAGYDQAAAVHAVNRPLLPGEIGCTLSHLAAARQLVASGAPFGLVMEDDFVPGPDCRLDLPALLAWLDGQTAAAWHIINLGRKAKRLSRLLHALPSGRRVMRADYFPVTTSALLWSRAGAQRFLAEHQQISMPVDVFLQGWCTANATGLACKPALFDTAGSASLIGAPVRRGTSTHAVGVTRHLRRLRTYRQAIAAYLGFKGK